MNVEIYVLIQLALAIGLTIAIFLNESYDDYLKESYDLLKESYDDYLKDSYDLLKESYLEDSYEFLKKIIGFLKEVTGFFKIIKDSLRKS